MRPHFPFLLFARLSMMSSVPPETKPQTLDGLLANAEFSMRKFSRILPTLFLIGAVAPLMFMSDNLDDEASKDDFATNARLMCIAHAAAACVTLLPIVRCGNGNFFEFGEQNVQILDATQGPLRPDSPALDAGRENLCARPSMLQVNGAERHVDRPAGGLTSPI